ncbi:hypothetical protein [Variovorax sp. YR216]|uniref:hypothetical protein n=1 Tax=Variovorax sp. YR216 TaxID=1882828 RepID=UPI00089461F0|nr:hypothetical protein [Variovorax sp. YR216]SEB25451.1 hypothetical protein SAMN05444680_12547 [Variovorax sp. YR216]
MSPVRLVTLAPESGLDLLVAHAFSSDSEARLELTADGGKLAVRARPPIPSRIDQELSGEIFHPAPTAFDCHDIECRVGRLREYRGW